MARALGQRVARTRAALVASFVLLSGGAVAIAGPIAFVGLIVPHIARGVVGADYRWVVPYSILIGAILIMVADVAGRLVARPDEIQVGIVMAVLGVPVFIALVRRRKLAEL
jgi:iron complex transport system permease protein